MPHTADLRIEAWAASPEDCVAEAVAALVDSVAAPAGRPPTRVVSRRVTGRTDADRLVAVLDEVVYLLDTTGELPVHTEVSGAPDGVRVRFVLAPIAADQATGAVPKAVTLHDLEFGPEFGPGGQGWWCAVTVDV